MRKEEAMNPNFQEKANDAVYHCGCPSCEETVSESLRSMYLQGLRRGAEIARRLSIEPTVNKALVIEKEILSAMKEMSDELFT